ncbi:MAG: hypothetical protein HFI16_08000 [Lachnospiraceae bacterium]|nr:hypothetical protein [Lachnospiraceae bacterium]
MGYSYKHREFVYRHQYPKKSSALFTYHKYPAPGGGYLDDGICELCGRSRVSPAEPLPGTEEGYHGGVVSKQG